MSDCDELYVVLSTVSEADDAERLANRLVGESLAACIQVEGPIESHYRWAGEIRREQEYRLLMKTSAASLDALIERLGKIHPYDEPQIVAIPVSKASVGYRRWVIDQTT